MSSSLNQNFLLLKNDLAVHSDFGSIYWSWGLWWFGSKGAAQHVMLNGAIPTLHEDNEGSAVHDTIAQESNEHDEPKML